MPSFAKRVIDWQRESGRHHLPWQGADAYRVWLSEIMLQQTQVATVIPYYERFITRFPDIAALAHAAEGDVLALWSGLGYYTRARNLYRAARLVMEQHGGRFPRAFENVLALPGVGRSTAAAICALAFRERRAILDGNVKRIIARHCAIPGYPGTATVEAKLWQAAETLLPPKHIEIYTQGLMDLGATLCTRARPQCHDCPVSRDCQALRLGLVEKLPTPRARKKLPEKRCTLVLLLSGADILLEKRLNHGIWGGLWCPPQLDSSVNVKAYCKSELGIDAKNAVALPDFTHTFTHFKLHIAPRLVAVMKKPRRAPGPGYIWLDTDEALSAAIPQPVRRLIRELQALPSG